MQGTTGEPRAGAAGTGAIAGIDLANRLLSTHRYGTAEHERGFEMMSAIADAPDGAWARWLLGVYHLQVPTRPGASTQAARRLRQAVEAGISPAFDRLADLYVQGIGLDAEPRTAIDLLGHLADRGHAPAAWQAAYLESGHGSPVACIAALAQACALAYPPAYYSLGLRYATGDGVAANCALARALLLRAADGGFLDAREAADELAPEQGDGEQVRDWHARLKANLAEAQPLLARLKPRDQPPGTAPDPLVVALREHFARLALPSMAAEGAGRDEPAGRKAAGTAARAFEWRSTRPRVGTCADFASREECAHLMNRVARKLTRPEGYLTSASDNDDAESRSFSGSGAPLDAMQTDVVVRTLERRFAAMADWPMAALEPCSIIRYQPGEEYKPHVDSFSERQIATNRERRGDTGGQRMGTFLVYLQAPVEGGQTEYPASNLAISGRRGMAVLHFNAHDDGRPDHDSLHIGRPVIAGEKWLWRSALRQFPLYR